MSSKKTKQATPDQKKKTGIFSFLRNKQKPGPVKDDVKLDTEAGAVVAAASAVNDATTHGGNIVSDFVEATMNPVAIPNTSNKKPMPDAIHVPVARTKAANHVQAPIVHAQATGIDAVNKTMESDESALETAPIHESTDPETATTTTAEHMPKIHKAATKIQAVFRGHKGRKEYLHKKKQATKVEAVARGFLVRKHVNQAKPDSDPTPITDADTEPGTTEEIIKSSD